MRVIWTKCGAYRRVEYESKVELEAATQVVQRDIFGPERLYLGMRKRTGIRNR